MDSILDLSRAELDDGSSDEGGEHRVEQTEGKVGFDGRFKTWFVRAGLVAFWASTVFDTLMGI